MGGQDAVVAGDQRHDRHRLRGVDGEIPPRMMLDRPILAMPSKLLITDLTGQKILEDRRVDLPSRPSSTAILPPHSECSSAPLV